METLSWLLFESPLALAIVGFFVLFVLLVHWRRSGRPRALLIGLGLVALCFLIQSLIETRKEQAATLLKRLEDDVVLGRVDSFEQLFAADFETGGLNRDEFIEWARGTLQRVDVQWAQRTALHIENGDDDRFQATASYFSNLQTNNEVGGVTSRWQIQFVRTPQGWRVQRIDPPRINGIEFSSWDRLRP